MWRPNPRNSRKIILRRNVQDTDKKDEFGHPVCTTQDTKVTAEVYPYSDPVKRQAIGITTEQAYTVLMRGLAPQPDDEVIISGKVYRIAAISDYIDTACEPVKIIAADTGRSAE
ncbi:head-tail adaptor protein [Clostridium sp. D33t1_170424_F3]|uniref:phage head completion protein n=1 Tax=Clostridium sp. D33t1_170424_F3 TaxID=2787099 RepID=UPI0018AA0E0E|nr:head-tail adaptor protein [Clostridium sp. D33t1_170424_F3]